MNITCTALSETLLESELFGHEKGAFTDAKTAKKGLFELSDGGTIFLDEVGDMPLGLQAKLLRFLEERTFRRVGGVQEISVDVRVIAATNRDIEQLIDEGSFRSDLMFRLNVIPVFLPQLRDRGDDLRLLAQHFVAEFSKEFRKPITQIDDDAYKKLYRYPWPGNVREVRNVIERAVLLCKSETIGVEDILLEPTEETEAGTDAKGIVLPPGGLDLRELENTLIRQALSRSNNNQAQAAKLLHLSRDAFRYRLEKHGLL
jgi:transcriptional regulator with PAS, ATPase and Fis domain